MNKEIILIDLGLGYTAKAYSYTFERLKLGRFKWLPNVHKRARKVYAYANIGIGPVLLHRMIAAGGIGQNWDKLKGKFVDHINGDSLDNRDDNLRLCTPGQNRANSGRDRDNRSGYKGVTWERTGRKWSAKINHQGVRYYLGVYQNKERAALAHDRAAIALHGEFAGLNFPERREKLRARDPRVVLGL